MNKTSPSRKSATRNAEAILSQSCKRQERLKIEQRLAQDAVTEKTARLRKLRLAKESADNQMGGSAPKAAPGGS